MGSVPLRFEGNDIPEYPERWCQNLTEVNLAEARRRLQFKKCLRSGINFAINGAMTKAGKKLANLI